MRLTAGLPLKATAVATLAAAVALLVAGSLIVGIWPPDARAVLLDWAIARAPLLAVAGLVALASAALVARNLLQRLVGFVPRLAHALELLGTGQRAFGAPPGLPPEVSQALALLARRQDDNRRSSENEVAEATRHLEEERDLLAAVLADIPAAAIACTRDARILLYTPSAQALLREVAPDTFLGLGRTLFALFRRSAIVHALARMDLARAAGGTAASTALLATRAGALLHARFTPFSGARLDGFLLHLRTNGEHGAAAFRDGARDDALPLEDIAAETLLELIRSVLQPGLRTELQLHGHDGALWLAAESYSLSSVLRDFCAREEVSGAQRVRLGLWADPDVRVCLQLRWSPARMMTDDRWRSWLETPLSAHGFRLPLAPAMVAEAHGGSLRLAAEADEAVLSLDLARVQAPQDRVANGRDARVEYAAVPTGADADDQRLDRLIYTVFDTETTGLDPGGGDRIIAIGGIRIVGGRILSREVFESLVRTSRRIDPAAQRIHGIDAAMLADQPPASEVLPRFRRFCEDTVLIGHNAAFDMRFLEIEAGAESYRFDLPVLDTLLLSQLVYPHAEPHSLEALAERLGLSVLGRHTALGDAILTAEVFLRLLPLLAARGMQTLSAVLDASARTPLARLRY